MKKQLLILPTIFLLILLVFFYLLIIDRNPTELPSTLLNKNIPKFEAESLLKEKKFVSSDVFGKKIKLVNFFVYDQHKNIITKLQPENRFYPVTNSFTTEVSIHTNLLGDLYMVLGEGNLNDGWIVRIYYNPLVIWIWIGALTIFLGGLISMNSNLKKLKRFS